MTKGTCASCLDFNVDKVVKSKESLKPTWLQEYDFVSNFVHNHDFKLKKKSNYRSKDVYCFYSKSPCTSVEVDKKLKYKINSYNYKLFYF